MACVLSSGCRTHLCSILEALLLCLLIQYPVSMQFLFIWGLLGIGRLLNTDWQDGFTSGHPYVFAVSACEIQ